MVSKMKVVEKKALEGKKYELIPSDKKSFLGKPLFQVKALTDFSIFKQGSLGGFIEAEKNLSQQGDAWVEGNARVAGDAWVEGDAWVAGDAWVEGDARVAGDAWVEGNAWVAGRFTVSCLIDFKLPRLEFKKTQDAKEYLNAVRKWIV